MTFADKLRSLRQKKGLTQGQLAEGAGVPLGTLRDYEQGKRRRDPSLATAVKLGKALGVTCEAFADCEDVAGEPAPKKKPAPKRSGKRHAFERPK